MVDTSATIALPSDTEIAIEVALELISVQRVAPFKFGIYYDAKKEPARVTVHRVVKAGTMGVYESNVLTAARIWCECALKEGYEVVRLTSGQDVSGSVERRRRYYQQKIKFQAMSPAERQKLDDVPF
jgi:hypothetical protein